MPADNVTLLAFADECRAAVAPGGCCCLSISPAHKVLSSKSTGHVVAVIDGTDRRANRQTDEQ